MADEAKARRVEEREVSEVESLAAVAGGGSAGSARELQENDVTRLRDALDALDEKVKLLVERHALLGERYATAVAARRDAEEELRRVSKGGLDPRALQQQVRELEARSERLRRHAAYLEDRIESLLARVRYVVES